MPMPESETQTNKTMPDNKILDIIEREEPVPFFEIVEQMPMSSAHTVFDELGELADAGEITVRDGDPDVDGTTAELYEVKQ